jgi:hypothetical protein
MEMLSVTRMWLTDSIACCMLYSGGNAMDWSYIAGYFDGEGSVRFKAPPSRPNYVLTSLSWSNTHLESLEAIQAFIGCGHIQHKLLKYGYTKQGHQLIVNRSEDVLRVGDQMLPHLIIKRQQLQDMLDFVRAGRKPAPATWGVLTDAGAEEVGRLYWEEHMTQRQIARKFGCSDGAVATFFRRHNIRGRPRGPVPQSETARRGGTTFWENKTAEERSAIMRERHAERKRKQEEAATDD